MPYQRPLQLNLVHERDSLMPHFNINLAVQVRTRMSSLIRSRSTTALWAMRDMVPWLHLGEIIDADA